MGQHAAGAKAKAAEGRRADYAAPDARYLRDGRRIMAVSLKAPRTTTSTMATQNRKCSAEMTAETTMNATSAPSRIRINFPMAPRYVIGRILESRHRRTSEG
jgi:hypothetical protein